MPRRAALVVLVTISAPWACESQRYSTAARENTRSAYLRFLARHPEGTRAEEARRRVERIEYWEARRADRPLGYNRYLRRYPGGTFARACRKRLADLAIARSTSAADLELVLERYPGTPAAQKARKRLPTLLADEAARSDDPALASRFLERFSASRESTRVREHLADLRYRGLSDVPPDLEAFVDEFGGTPAAARAEVRLERLMAQAVLETRDPAELRRFRARFPQSSRIPELERQVRLEQRDRAVARLDVPRLKKLGQEDPDAAYLAKWCDRRPRVCAKLVDLARRAGRWRPARGWEEVRRAVYQADPQQAWSAMEHLSWMDRPAAGDLLLELVGSERLSAAWAAERALGRWYANLPSTARRRWTARRRARKIRNANPDEVQRRAQLELLASRTDSKALDVLRRVAGQPSHQLTASYLLAQWEHRRRPGQSASRTTLVRFTTAARARLKWLRDAFPSSVHGDSLFSAVLAERELFALSRASALVKAAAGGASAVGLDEVRQESATLLADWRRRLAEQRTFTPARVPDLSQDVQTHESGRAEAIRTLVRAGRPGRLVARAVCRRETAPGCAAVPR